MDSKIRLQRPSFKALSYRLCLLSLCVVLSSCATRDSSRDWPADVPDRNHFVKAYEAKPHAKQSASALEYHLLWIKRFYQGTMIYPHGWLEMSEQVMYSLKNPKDQDIATKRLYKLGKRISSEWAQSNKVRKINSSNVAVWARALRTSADRGEQLLFIALVEKDVEGLLAQKLQSTEISYDRYYPEDDYDNF